MKGYKRRSNALSWQAVVVDLETRPKMHRLFLSVRPPEPVVAKLAELPRPRQHGVRWTAPTTWHITLRFLGNAMPAEVIAAVASVMPPPSTLVEVGAGITVLGSVVVVPALGLEDLAIELVSAACGIVDTDDERPFAAHLTLARLGTKATACELVGHRFNASFSLETVELVSSRTMADGPQHDTVHTWAASHQR